MVSSRKDHHKEGKTETSSGLWQTSQINLSKHERRYLMFSCKVRYESHKRLKTNPRRDLGTVNKVSIFVSV